MANDAFYGQCCLCGYSSVEWHHNLIWSGRQINEKEMILPLCIHCHQDARRNEIKEKLDLIMYRRMLPDQWVKYDRAGFLRTRFNYLSKKYLDVQVQISFIQY